MQTTADGPKDRRLATVVANGYGGKRLSVFGSSPGFLDPDDLRERMRDEEEIREQYEFLKEHLESEEMRHDGVERMFTYYKRALGWVLEEEHI